MEKIELVIRKLRHANIPMGETTEGMLHYLLVFLKVI